MECFIVSLFKKPFGVLFFRPTATSAAGRYGSTRTVGLREYWRPSGTHWDFEASSSTICFKTATTCYNQLWGRCFWLILLWHSRAKSCNFPLWKKVGASRGHLAHKGSWRQLRVAMFYFACWMLHPKQSVHLTSQQLLLPSSSCWGILMRAKSSIGCSFKWQACRSIGSSWMSLGQSRLVR